MSVVGNSNLMNHLTTAQTSTKLVAKNTVVDTVDDDSRPGGYSRMEVHQTEPNPEL